MPFLRKYGEHTIANNINHFELTAVGNKILADFSTNKPVKDNERLQTICPARLVGIINENNKTKIG